MSIVLVTGGFDPIHSGHIEYFNSAKELGDMLVVALNSDDSFAHLNNPFFLAVANRFCELGIRCLVAKGHAHATTYHYVETL